MHACVPLVSNSPKLYFLGDVLGNIFLQLSHAIISVAPNQEYLNTKAADGLLLRLHKILALRLEIWGPNLVPFSWLGLGLG